MPSEPKNIKIILVDDHPSLLLGLSMILNREPDLEVVAQFTNVRDCVDRYFDVNPDITIVDIKLKEESGIQILDSIRSKAPRAKFIILTSFDRDEDIYKCIKAGAAGFIVKDTPAEEIISAIRLVHSGRKHFPAFVTEKLSERMLMSDLSEREIEVLRHMVDGKSNKEIANSIGLAVGTVKYHINNIMSKLQVDDRTQAVVTALRKGILDL